MAPPRAGVKGVLGRQTKRPHRGRRLRSTRSGPVKGTDTDDGDRRLLDPAPLEEPESLWKLPQSERKPGRDQISAIDDVPQEVYPQIHRNVLGSVLIYLSRAKS